MIGINTSIDPFESLMFGTSNIKNYAGAMDASIVSNYITPLAQQYVAETIQRNNWYNSEAYYDQVRNYVVSKGPSIVHQDFIMPLHTPDQFRLANLTMQRWIMAEPTIRQAYVDGQICGYEDTYIDHEPGMVGEDQSDYRHVMNGIIQNEHAYIYVDNYSGEKPKLSIGEVSDILSTWSTASLLMDLGVCDITDPLTDNSEDPKFTEKPVDSEETE